MLLTRPLRILVAFTLICLFFYLLQPSGSPPYPSSQTTDDTQLVHWTKQLEHYPVKSFQPLPTGEPAKTPPIQHQFVPESSEEKRLRLERQLAVKEAFIHAWNGYRKHAWGRDEVAPVSGHYRNAFGGWGATLVDTMDTLWIMGMKKDFEECVKMVEKIDFTMNGLVVLNVFETTIRYLGGLLAAYDLSEGQYPTLLSKAIELGDILYSAFDTPNRMPVMRWEWQKTANGAPIEAAESTLIAEIGSLGLEFTRISQLTKDPKYFDAIQRVYDELEKAQPTTAIPGLWPIILDAKALTFTFNLFTLGGMADSAFEYLPKQYLLVSGRKDQYKNMYESAIEAAKNHLFFRPLVPTEKPLLFSGTAKAILDGPPVLDPQGQHLTCFAGGMVALGAKAFDRREDLEIARQLTEACMWAYESLPSGLMPEVFHTLPCQTGVSKPEDPTQCVWNIEKWHKGITDKFAETDAKVAEPPSAETYVKGKGLPPGFIDVDDARYILRPEAMESLFILYRLTGEQSFADSAWKMFSSIVNATETDIAHAGVKDVRKPMSKDSPDRQANLDDRMESFWTAETLKYAYLAFEEPGVVDLGQWVLNTEAHPLKIE